MLTPQEIRDVQFDKSVFGGYDMGSVDEFLSQLGVDYSQLYKENAVLKNKLKLLAETVEEYRSVDEAMRKALVTAQNMANDMIADAQKKANEMIENASIAAKTRVADLAEKITAEEKRLAAAKRATSDFVNELMEMYKKQAEMLYDISTKSDVVEEATSIEDTLSLATDKISQSVEEALTDIKNYQTPEVAEELNADDFIHFIEKNIEEKPEEEIGGKEAEAKKIEDDDDEIQLGFDLLGQNNTVSESTKKFDFSELKFGKNYDFDEDFDN